MPETAPIANRMAAAFAQRRVNIIHTGFFVLSASPSATQRSNGIPTPNTEKMIWNASEVPIWARAANKLDISTPL